LSKKEKLREKELTKFMNKYVKLLRKGKKYFRRITGMNKEVFDNLLRI
jgi:hypothetical protein